MRHLFSFLFAVIIVILSACKPDDDIVSTETLADQITRGAVLRTKQINNLLFTPGVGSSTFDVVLEEQDIENGDLLDKINVFVSYKPTGQSQATTPVLLKEIGASEFDKSENDLPLLQLKLTQEEIAEKLELSLGAIVAKDQFIISLDLVLTDDRIFNDRNGNPIVIAFNTFFSSPFEYTVNVAPPISDDLFTGIYRFESILDGPGGETFIIDEFVTLELGHSPNTRVFKAHHRFHHQGVEPRRPWEFAIIDDETVFEKKQLSTVERGCTFIDSLILLGPDAANGPVNSADDSVFELWFVEGYLGFDGGCGFGTAPSRYRFTKQ